MRIICCIFFLLPLLTIARQPLIPRQHDLVFQSVNLLPMDREIVLENMDVVVRNGVITAIGKSNSVKYDKNALVIDGKGKYLMPGLAEMHAHVPPVDDLAPMKEVLTLFAANGVTLIRGMLGHPRHLELRQKINSGEILGPRFYTSGPSLNGNTVNSKRAADSIVRQQKKAGYDFLKIHPGISRENFAHMAEVARGVKMPFAGHVPFQVGVWRAIDAGIVTIDHMDGFVEALVPEMTTISEQDAGLFAMFIGDKADLTRMPGLMNKLKEKNVWVVPTQALAERWFAPDKSAESLRDDKDMVYMAASTATGWYNSKKNLMNNPKYDSAQVARYIQLRRKLIYACEKHGVGLLLGSDAPQVYDVPGFSIHHELQYMVDAGLTPYEALKSGTVNVGKFYGRDDLGVIKKGAVADLVLLNNNPLVDIKHTRDIEGVMLGDKWLSRQFIDAELKKLEKRSSF